MYFYVTNAIFVMQKTTGFWGSPDLPDGPHWGTTTPQPPVCKLWSLKNSLNKLYLICC